MSTFSEYTPSSIVTNLSLSASSDLVENCPVICLGLLIAAGESGGLMGRPEIESRPFVLEIVSAADYYGWSG